MYVDRKFTVRIASPNGVGVPDSVCEIKGRVVINVPPEVYMKKKKRKSEVMVSS